jgi:phage/plasmid-associated DNA primase
MMHFSKIHFFSFSLLFFFFYFGFNAIAEAETVITLEACKAQDGFCKDSCDIPPETSPELAQGDGARLAFMTEPSGGMEFDVGLVKRMTGGDRTFSRGLHENGSSKILSFKVWISCNDIPAMSGFDDATKQRVLIIPFLSTWCKNAPSDPEEQMKQRRFPIDKYFEQNHINRLARALVWKLFHLYDESKQRDPDAPLPKVICDYVDSYWSSVDAYMAFHKEMIEEAPGSILTMSELFVAFGIWYAERNGGSTGGGGEAAGEDKAAPEGKEDKKPEAKE